MSIAGSLRDKALLAKAFGSELEIAVIKATSHDPIAPKQKHVELLRDAVKEKSIQMAQIFNPLKERLKESNWLVVLKSLMVIHELIREPYNQAMSYLAANPNILNVASFRSRATVEGLSKSRLIESYAAYLEERAFSCRDFRMDFVLKSMEKEGRLCAKTNPQTLIKDITGLQKLIDLLLSVQVGTLSVDEEVVMFTYQLLVKDLLKLYHALNEGVINILENYFTMNITDASQSLEIYKTFIKQTESVINFLDTGRKYRSILSIDIPLLKAPPSSLIDSLSSYLAGLDPNATPSLTANQRDNLPPVKSLDLSPQSFEASFPAPKRDVTIPQSQGRRNKSQPQLGDLFANPPQQQQQQQQIATPPATSPSLAMPPPKHPQVVDLLGFGDFVSTPQAAAAPATTSSNDFDLFFGTQAKSPTVQSNSMNSFSAQPTTTPFQQYPFGNSAAIQSPTSRQPVNPFQTSPFPQQQPFQQPNPFQQPPQQQSFQFQQPNLFQQPSQPFQQQQQQPFFNSPAMYQQPQPQPNASNPFFANPSPAANFNNKAQTTSSNNPFFF